VDFEFTDRASGAVLSRGASRFRVERGQAARDVWCVSIASNGGGVSEALSSRGLRLSPPAEVAATAASTAPVDPGLALSISRSGRVTVSNAARVGLRYRLTLIDRAGRTFPTGEFSGDRPPRLSVPAGRYRACLSSVAVTGFAAGSICIDHVVPGRAADLLRRGSLRRRGGRYAAVLVARRGLIGRRVRVVWTVAGRRAVRRVVRLRSRTTVRSPRVRRRPRLSISVPSVRVDGVPYDAGRL
jgi:hypothetical protein